MMERNGKPIVVQQVTQPAAPAQSTFRPPKTAATDSPVKGLYDKITGATYRDYNPVINQGYQNLGQPGGGDHDAITYNAVLSLAEPYAQRVFDKTGKLPTEDQVRQFVAQNLSQGYAQKFIQGLPRDQILANYVDPAIEADALNQPATGTGATNAVEDRILGLNDQLDTIYNKSSELARQGNEDIYGKAKRGLADDLAGQGLLTQPTSRYSLDALEGEKNKSLGQTMATLAADRASGGIDLSKTIENLLAGERRAGEQVNQFKQGLSFKNKEFNAGRDDTYFNQGMKNRELDMASMLGRLQAGGQGDSGLAGAGGGALGGAALGSKFGPWGALAGGVGGGLLGYFTSKK